MKSTRAAFLVAVVLWLGWTAPVHSATGYDRGRLGLPRPSNDLSGTGPGAVLVEGELAAT